jgi:hypothetical protein
MGGLAERGLPSDRALGAVRDRLGAGADDAELVRDVPGLGRSTPQGAGPVGPALAGNITGLPIPASGVGVPVGPPTGTDRPGRGRGRGPGG